MSKRKVEISIGIVWLFHLSGILGIVLGSQEWFVKKTLINLSICFVLLLYLGPINGYRQYLSILLFFLAGILVEWIGVTTGFPFGVYHYGKTLGLKVDGVPYMIGINWAMLVLITGTLASKITHNTLIKILIGASLMVFLDLFIEPTAEALDLWHWQNGNIPLSNYIAWFAMASGLHWLFQETITSLNFQYSLHLYLAQLTFFISLNVYFQV